MAIGLALLAMLVEVAVGYPRPLFGRIGHPVTWIGSLIAALERRWNVVTRTPAQRRKGGQAVVAVLLLVSAATGGIALLILPLHSIVGLILLAILCSSLIAQRSLHEHVAAVATALETAGLEAGRQAVSQIVGRDPDQLDESAVCRAAIESLAENFSDGIVAPVLWLAALGPAGGIAYKAINTADSMIGHMNDRYADFGRAAAILDDWINLPASRLSALLVAAAALTQAGASAKAALAAVRRDAKHHRSPNAGWPEAAMAGALGISIAGPRHYSGVLTEDREMNEGGRRHLGPADIRRALDLYRRADMVLFAALAGLWAVVG
jgi:adenosylcobinamide-phosphate synthase